MSRDARGRQTPTPDHDPGLDRRPIHAVDRWRQILERVAADQTIHVPALARELGVSEMTIRRDIRRLERDGFVRQTYGGAAAHLTRSFDVAFNARALLHAREKRLIGMRATELLGDARIVYLGIGTTAEQFARYLPAREDLTVVTASLPIASLLGTRSIKVVCLGGAVLPQELSCIGSGALRTLATYRFDLAVVGAGGLSARWGITELTDEEAEVQRSALERAGRVVVIADGSKIGADTPAVVAPADRIATLVTDPTAPDDELERLRDAGVDVIVARQRQRSTDDRPAIPAGAMAAGRPTHRPTDPGTRPTDRRHH